MESVVRQNNSSYNPVVLEEHTVGNGPDHTKRANTIVIIGVILFVALVAWYVISKKQNLEQTPEETLVNLAGQSAPITTTVSERAQEGQSLATNNGKRTTSTPDQRLQILNSLNQ